MADARSFHPVKADAFARDTQKSRVQMSMVDVEYSLRTFPAGHLQRICSSYVKLFISVRYGNRT